MDLRVRQPDHVQPADAHLRLRGRSHSVQTRKPVPVPQRGHPQAARTFPHRRGRHQRLLLLHEPSHVRWSQSESFRRLSTDGSARRAARHAQQPLSWAERCARNSPAASIVVQHRLQQGCGRCAREVHQSSGQRSERSLSERAKLGAQIRVRHQA